MSSKFHGHFTSFDFVKIAKSSGFLFTCYKEQIEWDKLGHVDLDRVVRDVDIGILQQYVGTIVRCDLGELRGVDPGLVKLFRLAQLCLEYSIFCQEQLMTSREQLETNIEQALKDLEATKKRLKQKQDELKKIKRRDFTREKENVIWTSSAVFQCKVCPKSFESAAFLEAHVKRRHIESNESSATENKVEELKTEIDSLKAELLAERGANREAQLAAKEAQLKHEEALWAQVEKAQSEQRARHQAELMELTQTFQNQLKQNLALRQLTSPPPQTVEMQQMSDLKSELEAKKKEEVLAAVSRSEEAWQARVEEVEISHRAQLERIRLEWEAERHENLKRFSVLEASVSQLRPEPDANPQAVPKPARRRRLDLRSLPSTSALSTGQISSSPCKDNDTSQTDALASSLKSPTSTSTPMVPPRKVNHSITEEKEVIKKAERPKTLQLDFSKPSSSRSSLNFVPSSKSGAVRKSIPITPEPGIDSSESETSEASDVAAEAIQDMKEVLKKNPEVLQELRSEVENIVQHKLSEFGIDEDTEGLQEKEVARIESLLSHQHKLTKKKFKDYLPIRRKVEKKVDDELKNQGLFEGVVEEPNVKPSKLKKSFFSKLALSRKHKKMPDEIFTSTPVQESSKITQPSTTPQGILKSSTEQLWVRDKGASSEPSSPNNRAGVKQNLERVLSSQSLPAPKTVTFAATTEQRAPSTASSSWDDDSETITVAPSQENLKSSSEKIQEDVTDILKSFPPRAQPISFGIVNNEHKIVPSFIAPSFLGSNKQESSLNGSTAVSTNKTKSATNSADNSWDLEDI